MLMILLLCNPAGKEPTIWDSPTRIEPIARARFELGRRAEAVWAGSGEVGHLRLVARGVSARLLSSTLTNLGEMFEDDKVPEILPMDVEACDIRISIIVRPTLSLERCLDGLGLRLYYVMVPQGLCQEILTGGSTHSLKKTPDLFFF